MNERHEPGPALDKLIAERVFGWQWVRDARGAEGWAVNVCALEGCIVGRGAAWDGSWIDPIMPRFSADIAAAWRVVEQLRADDYELTLHCHHHNPRGVAELTPWTHAQFTRGGTRRGHNATAATDAHAICLAALEVRGLV